MIIRDLLGVQSNLRALTSSPYRPSAQDQEQSDAWATLRCQSLRNQGIEAQLKRYSPEEALCVVYKTGEILYV